MSIKNQENSVHNEPFSDTDQEAENKGIKEDESIKTEKVKKVKAGKKAVKPAKKEESSTKIKKEPDELSVEVKDIDSLPRIKLRI